MSRISAALILSILLISSCATDNKITTSFKTETMRIDDSTFTFQLLPEDYLGQLYGRDGNVFANYPGLLSPKKIFVFQVDIEAGTGGLDINVNDFNFQLGEISGQSRTKRSLLRSWQTYLKDDSSKDKAVKITKQNMFRDKIVIAPDETISGWIVFLENYPNREDAELSLKINNSMDISIPIDFTVNP